MGIDSVYYPPKQTKREKLESFFQLLGYMKSPISYDDEFLQEYSPTSFTYFSQKPYESLQGVFFTVMIEKNKLTPTVVKDSILAIGVTKVYHHGFDN